MTHEYVPVRRDAVEWLKEKFPALCEKAGLAERVGGRLYTLTTLRAINQSADGQAQQDADKVLEDSVIHGIGVSVGGKHIDLKDFYIDADMVALPDPHQLNKCQHPACGKFDGPRSVECRAMADNACARGDSARPDLRDWEISCGECAGDGHVRIKRQVAERDTDVITSREPCEVCDERGYVIAHGDVPGIEEYVDGRQP